MMTSSKYRPMGAAGAKNVSIFLLTSPMAFQSPRHVLDWLTPWTHRLRRGRFALASAAIILFALESMGVLTLVQALGGFSIIVIAVLIPLEGETGTTAAPLSEDKSSLSDWLVESIISGLPDAVIALDRDGRIVAWNAAAQKIMLPLARSAPLSLVLRNPDVIEAVRRVAMNGRAERVEFYERTPLDHWTEAHVVPIALPETMAGERELVILTLHDLTPLRRAEEIRTDFVANASHELRTPLASLSGFIETLQGPARDDVEARERFLGIMKEQATRMARLIDDLLSLSRVELKENVRPEQKIDLIAVVRQVADSLQPLAQERNVVIKIDCPSEPLTVFGDHDELIRVFENLIDNALKYGVGGKRVDIALVRAPEGEAAVTVRDYGPGLAPEHLPRLTERFYRVDVRESRAQGGTGLGLALVKHIVNRHRGKLTIDSAPGEGASFTVRLPLAEGMSSV
jgi:two-component system phosphate regulon sensor histidine kinase PhoR